MKNLLRICIASSITMLCCILAFTACPQPVKRDSQQSTQQENGSKEVLTAIKNINMVTVEVQAGSEEILKGGERITQEMRTLDDLTHIITDTMNAMASGVIQINNAVQEVNEVTQKNKRSIDDLAKEVGKLKYSSTCCWLRKLDGR